jgi:hypothetical protein
MPGNNTVPIYNPDGLWQIWNFNDVYTGPSGAGQYVPKVGDLVYQIVDATKTEYVVTARDPVTDLTTLRLISGAVSDGEFTMNILFGVGPGTQADTYIAYLDKSVTPYRLTVDSRTSVAGSLVNYCKIFAGSDLSAATGTVISAMYDTGGNYLGENVPMTLAGSWQGQDLITNTAIKVPQPCRTNANLADGDLVTAVFYDQTGFVVSKRQLLIWNTGFVRGLDQSSKEVISIGLETPFLAGSNSKLINYPVNVPINAMNLVGVVNYSDGSLVRWAVDGTRFSVTGLDAYAPTIVGQEVPIVLKYQLQTGESAYGMSNQNTDHISDTYTVVTQAVSGSYAVKLFCYPVWISPQAGYRLSWWLYDLARSILYDVTNQVQIDTNVSAYQALAYGTKQTLRVFVNLQDVNAIYQDFFHVQVVDVILNNPETTRPAINAVPNWTVTPDSGTVPLYGHGVHATYYAASSNSNQVKLMGDYTDFPSWLNAYFTQAMPLYNPTTETQAPDPTHFAILVAGTRTEYPISQWNQVIVLSQVLSNNDTLFLQFFRRTSQADLQLCTSGVSLFKVNSLGNYI